MPKHALFGKILQKFRRTTSSGAYLPELDFLRFIAIGLVLVLHYAFYVAITYQPRFAGDSLQSPLFLFITRVIADGGVQLFFAISGFILAVPFASAYIHQTQPPRLRTYFLRRITRLEPPYAIAMIVIAALLVIIKHNEFAGTARHLAASLLYSHGFIYADKSSISFVTWSLEIEIQFYIVMPLLARLYLLSSAWQRRTVLIIGAAVFALFQQFVLANWQGRFADILRLSLLNYIQYFLAGLFLADIYCTNNRSFGRPGRVWDWAALFGWPLLLVLWAWPEIAAFTVPALIVLLYCASFRGPVASSIARWPWLGVIGGMCYSLYLLHVQVIGAGGPLFRKVIIGSSFPLTLLLQTALLSIGVLGISSVYFLLIEKPCMQPGWPKLAAKWVQARFPGARAKTAQSRENIQP
jgi:peptidoglycan/LPS O-acetylase OafA/YrhL